MRAEAPPFHPKADFEIIGVYYFKNPSLRSGLEGDSVAAYASEGVSPISVTYSQASFMDEASTSLRSQGSCPSAGEVGVARPGSSGGTGAQGHAVTNPTLASPCVVQASQLRELTHGPPPRQCSSTCLETRGGEGFVGDGGLVLGESCGAPTAEADASISATCAESLIPLEARTERPAAEVYPRSALSRPLSSMAVAFTLGQAEHLVRTLYHSLLLSHMHA